MITASVSTYYPRRVQITVGDERTPPKTEDGIILDPREYVRVYNGGSLLEVESYTWDSVLSRYLLFFSEDLDLTLPVQVIYHSPSTPFLLTDTRVSSFALIATVTGVMDNPADQLIIFSPEKGLLATTIHAKATFKEGATYAWAITGGVFEGATDTYQCAFRATTPGTVVLSVTITLAGQTYPLSKNIEIIPDPTFACAEYYPAGTRNITVTTTDPGAGWALTWSGSAGLDIKTSVGTSMVFDVGVAGTEESVTTTILGYGMERQITKTFRIMPYEEQQVITTASLAPNDGGIYTRRFGAKFLVTRVMTDNPARIRCYISLAKLDEDRNRLPGLPPAAGHGLLCEAITDKTTKDITMNPIALITGNASGDYYWLVENKDQTTNVITVALATKRLEA